jgi:hypothetical protein
MVNNGHYGKSSEMDRNNRLRYVELITKPLMRGINNIISHDVIKR